jgi:serine/threonine protein kinase
VHAELIFTGGTGENRRVPLFLGKTYTLGRSRKSDIVLVGSKVSRQHTTVRLGEQGLVVLDAGSRNGTFHHGYKIGEGGALLSNGDTFQIGDFSLTLRSLDEATSAARAIEGPRLPGYEPLARIGLGAYSRVFSAIQRSTGTLVAIKTLTVDEEDELQRFEREARIMSELDSPRLVKVLEFVSTRKSHHIVMEFVDGRTIHERTRGEGVPISEAVKVGLGIAEGLLHLHQAGIVHRDVKPSNVLLPYAGGAKLTDLGIAKKLEGDSALTAEGQGLGTFGYMPPEQALNARGVDSRSDLYGLGATLYHLLTGRPPFRFRPIAGQQELRAAIKVLQNRRPVLPSVHAPETPSWFEDLVMQLLSKTPGERGEMDEVVRKLADMHRVLKSDQTASMDETWHGF